MFRRRTGQPSSSGSLTQSYRGQSPSRMNSLRLAWTQTHEEITGYQHHRVIAAHVSSLTSQNQQKSEFLPLSRAGILRRGLFCNSEWMERKTGTFPEWRPAMGTVSRNEELSDHVKTGEDNKKGERGTFSLCPCCLCFCLS